MKKSIIAILCLLLILSIAFGFVGCKSREQRLNEETTYEDTQIKAADDFVPTLAAKLKLSETDLNRKINNTAKKYGMTREQVLQQLSRGM